MKKLLAALAFALALAAPSAASAQSFFGLRIGYGIPFGSAAGGLAERDLVKGVVPLQADLGLRLGPVDLGGYLSYGFATPPSDCPGNCSENVVRLGVQGVLHSPLGHERAIWAGVLAGWERAKLSPGIGSASVASGWEGGLQGGYDFTSSSTGFGPFLQLTFGQYDSLEVNGVRLSGFERKYHEVFQLGVRGYFKL